MKRIISLLMAAGAIVAAPAVAMTAPPSGSPGAMHSQAPTTPMATPSAPTMAPATAPSPGVAPGQGQFNGQGYNHSNAGQAKGQPNQSCETAGTRPGNAASAPGGGSPFTGGSSKAGSKYAGSQPQNSRNSASVSQYDVACANQPH